MNISNLNLFFRYLQRNKLYTGITVLGFALSLTFVILLGAYIRQEVSVDQFHTNKDRIFRAVHEDASSFGPAIGNKLQSMYPEIECYTRLYQQSGLVDNLQNEKVAFHFLLADSAFFRMFSFRLLEGDAATVLSLRHSAVLTRSFALKLFGNESAMGKELNFGNLKLTVTGIMEDMPPNTHFDKCDALLPFPGLEDIWGSPGMLQDNQNSSFGLYFMTKEGTDLPAKAPEILKFFKKEFWLYQDGYVKHFAFEPLTKCYFGGKGGTGVHGNSKVFVTIQSAIALVILLIALINYINLSVAQAGFRAKEAAVKKLVGTDNRQLFRQFIEESVILCFISFGLATLFSSWFLPVFNQLLDTHVVLEEHLSVTIIVSAIIAILALGTLAGLIPAFLITRFNPVEIAKGAFRYKIKSTYSNILISFQYTITIALLVCTIVIWKQTDFLRHYQLGFNQENVICIQNEGVSGKRKAALRSEFEKIPGVTGVSFVCGNPIDGGNNNSFTYNDRKYSFQSFKIDTAFFRLLEIEVEQNNAAESQNGMWMNETAAKIFESDSIPTDIPLLGIVKNFHFRDLTQAIGPATFYPLEEKEWPWSILVKVNSPDLGKVYKQITDTYRAFLGGIPAHAEFMDQTINRWYEGSERTGRLIGYFSILAIVLSMMGILAMAAYFLRQRVKEIGIRRVNGATVEEVFRMLIYSFMKWILLSFIIACPMAWYAMSRWLGGFAYRIELSWWIFILAGFLAAGIALSIVGWQCVKVATANPVNSLKRE